MDKTTPGEKLPSEVPHGKLPLLDPQKLTSTSISPGKDDDLGAKTEEVSAEGNQEAPVYVEGLKLAIVVASVALSCFLMLLDTMVISTVSYYNIFPNQLRSN